MTKLNIQLYLDVVGRFDEESVTLFSIAIHKGCSYTKYITSKFCSATEVQEKMALTRKRCRDYILVQSIAMFDETSNEALDAVNDTKRLLASKMGYEVATFRVWGRDASTPTLLMLQLSQQKIFYKNIWKHTYKTREPPYEFLKNAYNVDNFMYVYTHRHYFQRYWNPKKLLQVAVRRKSPYFQNRIYYTQYTKCKSAV